MKTCPRCKGACVVTEMRWVQGYKAAHNAAVRNYRGGPRPRVTDQREPVEVTCPTCKGAGSIREEEDEPCSS